MEGFSRLLSKASSSGSFPGLRVSGKVPPISHLLYRDDMLVFSKANLQHLQVLLSILDQFQTLSRRQINLNKSACLLSPRLYTTSRNDIISFLGMQSLSARPLYLGLPLSFGR